MSIPYLTWPRRPICNGGNGIRVRRSSKNFRSLSPLHFVMALDVRVGIDEPNVRFDQRWEPLAPVVSRLGMVSRRVEKLKAPVFLSLPSIPNRVTRRWFYLPPGPASGTAIRLGGGPGMVSMRDPACSFRSGLSALNDAPWFWTLTDQPGEHAANRLLRTSRQ